jgi:hypothetical protein
MQAHRMKVTVPEDHQLEIRLPQDFPAGPAELIVLAGPAAGAEEPNRVSGNLLTALENLRSMERTEEEERVLEEFDRVPATQRPNAREVIRQIRELRHGITLGSLSLREMIEEGRHG